MKTVRLSWRRLPRSPADEGSLSRGMGRKPNTEAELSGDQPALLEPPSVGVEASLGARLRKGERDAEKADRVVGGSDAGRLRGGPPPMAPDAVSACLADPS